MAVWLSPVTFAISWQTKLLNDFDSYDYDYMLAAIFHTGNAVDGARFTVSASLTVIFNGYATLQ